MKKRRLSDQTVTREVAKRVSKQASDSGEYQLNEQSGSSIRVGNNSVLTKSRGNRGNSNDNNNDIIILSDTDSCSNYSNDIIILSDTDSYDNYLEDDISKEALIEIDQAFDANNHEHGRTVFVVKSHPAKEILPNQARNKSMEQNQPDVIYVNTKESPVPGSYQWLNLMCPGIFIDGEINMNAFQKLDRSQKARIRNEMGGVPKAQGEPKAFSGIFCPEAYINGIRCIAHVSKKGDICDYHRKGELRQVTCTSFTKKGLRCTRRSYKMRHSQQEEWGYLCWKHKNSMFQRGHLYRSGMCASLLARVQISPSLLLKEQKEQEQYKDLCFELSRRKTVIITADKLNDLTKYLTLRLRRAPETVETTLNHIRKKVMTRFIKNASRKDIFIPWSALSMTWLMCVRLKTLIQVLDSKSAIQHTSKTALFRCTIVTARSKSFRLGLSPRSRSVHFWSQPSMPRTALVLSTCWRRSCIQSLSPISTISLANTGHIGAIGQHTQSFFGSKLRRAIVLLSRKLRKRCTTCLKALLRHGWKYSCLWSKSSMNA